MEKAYDVKGLVEELKGHGLELAEETAKVAVKGVMAWIAKSAQMSENKYDDLLLAVLPKIEEYVMEKVDDINKADNQ